MAFTPIPIFQLARTVNAFNGFQDRPIQISKILLDNQRLYVHKTVEKSAFAVVKYPIAVESFPMACVFSPIAVAVRQVAIV